jgi:hypothetical protein
VKHTHLVAAAAYPAAHTLVGAQGEGAACQHLQLQGVAPGVGATLVYCCCLLLLLLVVALEGVVALATLPGSWPLLLLLLLAPVLLAGVVAWVVEAARVWALLGVGVAWAVAHWTGPHVAVPCPPLLPPAHAAPPPAGYG